MFTEDFKDDDANDQDDASDSSNSDSDSATEREQDDLDWNIKENNGWPTFEEHEIGHHKDITAASGKVLRVYCTATNETMSQVAERYGRTSEAVRRWTDACGTRCFKKRDSVDLKCHERTLLVLGIAGSCKLPAESSGLAQEGTGSENEPLPVGQLQAASRTLETGTRRRRPRSCKRPVERLGQAQDGADSENEPLA